MTDELLLNLAVQEALVYKGATSPNPPVGAVIVKNGLILGIGAHQKASTAHAEVNAIASASNQSLKGATLYVTLEPCNHTGQTPPCVNAILEAGISKVVIGSPDPNPKVAGGGAEALKAKGVKVEFMNPESGAGKACAALIAPFAKWVTTGKPYLVHKLALRLDSKRNLTLLPPEGAKTFTQDSSLELAHRIRKQSDAIITGMGTVLADEPLFTVRKVEDHPGKKRFLAVVGDLARLKGENKEIWEDWSTRQNGLGFEVLVFPTLKGAVEGLGPWGVHQALIEAGEGVSKTAQAEGLWDRRVTIIAGRSPGSDFVFEELNSSDL